MTISYFGYGSLVNTDTLSCDTQVVPGTLSGWIRQWGVTSRDKDGRGVCALCVVPRDGVEIRGVLAREPKSGLERLERREHSYDKVVSIGAQFRCDARAAAGPDDMFLFQAKQEHYGWGDAQTPIQKSYIDCVLAGFYAFWGEEGVHHFIETTEGWHVPVLDDRGQPRYPRAIVLEDRVRAVIDDALAGLDLTVLKL